MLVKEEAGSVEEDEGLVRIGVLSAVMEIIYTSQCEDYGPTKGYKIMCIWLQLFVCVQQRVVHVCPLHTKIFVQRVACTLFAL